jgi:cytochrome c
MISMRSLPIFFRSDRRRADSPFARRLAPALLFVLVATPALAAGDIDAGRRLTQQWCTGCHVAARSGSGTDSAPPLPNIAQHQGRDRQWLRTWLTAPHPPMPNLNLSRQEIENIIAYLESLAQP